MKMPCRIGLIVLVYSAVLFPAPAHAQFVQQGPKLVATDAVGGAYQGFSVSLSADGNTALVGGSIETWVWTRSGGVWSQQARLANLGGSSLCLSADGNTAILASNAGAVVWSRSGEDWARQGLELVGSDASEGIYYTSHRVSLSADGNTAIVGAPHANGGFGAAWLFTRSGGAWTQQGPKLAGSGAVANAQQGNSVSLSADGDTAIVGGWSDNGGVGAAWVWIRSGGVWTQQGAKLASAAAGRESSQGISVSLSADGNRAIIGGFGAAWVWARSGGVWAQQGPKLVGASAVSDAAQGFSVSLSSDGDTAIVGEFDNNPFNGPDVGAAWVWNRSGGVWTQQGPKLAGADAAGEAMQGCSVSLSANGNTAIVGGFADNTDSGAAWVWTRSGGVWTQQGAKLVASGASGVAQQGSAVSLSANGNTAIVGGSADNTNSGAAWVWTRSGGVWSQGQKMAGSGAVGQSSQGISVSMSADGNTAIVGGSTDDNNVYGQSKGAAWIWTRSGGIWTQQGGKLVGSGSVSARQGWAVSLSGDGNTAIVGGFADNSGVGAAWVWTRKGGVWTQQGPKLVGSDSISGNSEEAGSEQGSSVSLSADGNTAIVGGFDNGSGAVWIWTRSGGIWTQQGPKLAGAGTVGSVSLSANGNTAIVGGYSAWVWTRSEGVWTKQGPMLTASDARGSVSVALSGDGNTAIVGGSTVWTMSGGIWTKQRSLLIGPDAVGGFSVSSASLSADGNTAIVGGENDNNWAGAAWVFEREGPRRRGVRH